MDYVTFSGRGQRVRGCLEEWAEELFFSRLCALLSIAGPWTVLSVGRADIR